MYSERLYNTLVELISIPSTSGHEEQIRAYLEGYFATMGLAATVQSGGNLIVTVPSTPDMGKPLLLNAHMDRVPPGLGHTPILRDDVLYSNGQTNLGADDAAGMVIILEVVRRVLDEQLPHPPLVLVFTVQEEVGMCGAVGFDGSPWQVQDGIVFDNAFAAGVVVSRGASYEAFDVTITGRTGHPGKDLAHTVNALEIFRRVALPLGSLDNDQTRINIGRIQGGSARNAVPALLTLEGEMRSFAAPEVVERQKRHIQHVFEQAAQQLGGSAEVTFTTHAQGYSIDEGEPLLQTYRSVLEQRGASVELQPTFIGSDTSSFRAGMRVFTLSTGVVNEHSFEEYVPLAPLEQVVQDTLETLRLWSNQP